MIRLIRAGFSWWEAWGPGLMPPPGPPPLNPLLHLILSAHTFVNIHVFGLISSVIAVEFMECTVN